MKSDRFFDTNILLYRYSDDAGKAEIARGLINEGGIVSVQVLSEFTSVARRKFKFDWPRVRLALAAFDEAFQTLPVSIASHERALDIAEVTGITIYDALHLACAEEAGCTTFISEDLNHGQRIGAVAVFNPFR